MVEPFRLHMASCKPPAGGQDHEGRSSISRDEFESRANSMHMQARATTLCDTRSFIMPGTCKSTVVLKETRKSKLLRGKFEFRRDSGAVGGLQGPGYLVQDHSSGARRISSAPRDG